MSDRSEGHEDQRQLLGDHFLPRLGANLVPRYLVEAPLLATPTQSRGSDAEPLPRWRPLVPMRA